MNRNEIPKTFLIRKKDNKLTPIVILTSPKYMLKIYNDDFMTKENIALLLNTTVEIVESWIILGLECITLDDIVYINYGSVCDLIASGRA